MATGDGPNEDERGAKWIQNPDIWMVILTAILMLVGIYTAWVFHKQFGEMSTQTKILSGQAKQAHDDSVAADEKARLQLDLAGKQVKAAQQSATAIQRQMRQDQRAWLQVRLSLPDTLAENQPVTGLSQLTNIGRTPAAKKVINEMVIEMVPNGSQPEFKYNYIPRLTETVGVILPNLPPENSTPQLFHRKENSDIPEPTLLTHDDILNLTSGRAYLVIHSRVRYYDVFGASHWIKSCAWKPYSTSNHLFTVGKCTAYQDVDSN